MVTVAVTVTAAIPWGSRRGTTTAEFTQRWTATRVVPTAPVTSPSKYRSQFPVKVALPHRWRPRAHPPPLRHHHRRLAGRGDGARKPVPLVKTLRETDTTLFDRGTKAVRGVIARTGFHKSKFI